MADHTVSGSSIGGRGIDGASRVAPLVGARERPASVATTTMTLTETSAIPAASETEVLRLSLVPRPTVRWDENVQDNEGLGRKSSKRCCIFHKQRDFGESSTDSSEDEIDDSHESDSDKDIDKKPKALKRKIAKPKSKGTPVPDHQRFHA